MYLQEFMILPVGAGTFTEAMKMATEVYHTLKVCVICPGNLSEAFKSNWRNSSLH